MNIQEFKEKLLKSKEELEKELKKAKKISDYGSDVDSFEEETDEAEEYSANLGIQEVFKKQLNEINNALAKIESGRYGICEKCGQKIEEKVLKISPASQFCQKCKKIK